MNLGGLLLMKKIILIGSGGAGKSTLARQLGEKLNIEVFHLDALLWKPHWEMTERAYQIEVQNELMAHDSWIIDGNYGGTMDLRISQADTIIFLDRSRWICLYQVVKRYFQYQGTSRPDMQEDCPEKLDMAFLSFIWNFPNKQKIQVEKKLTQVITEKQVFTLKNKKQINLFLSTL